MTDTHKPACAPLIASTFGGPPKEPPRWIVTNDERLMGIRSRRCTEREAREEVEAAEHRSPFG